MEDKNKKYEVPQEEVLMTAEPANGSVKMAQLSDKSKVNLAQLMSDGYMTLAQSKAIIEQKIHNHFQR